MGLGRMATTRRYWLVLTCLFLIIAACKPAQPELTIEAPEAKLSPTLIGVVSVFMKINNSGKAGDVLVGAHTDLPGALAELHDIVDGKMVKVPGIEIPADETVLLRAARYHIMIFGMPKGTKEGTQFDLVLNFKKSGDKRVHLVVTPFSNQKRLHN